MSKDEFKNLLREILSEDENIRELVKNICKGTDKSGKVAENFFVPDDKKVEREISSLRNKLAESERRNIELTRHVKSLKISIEEAELVLDDWQTKFFRLEEKFQRTEKELEEANAEIIRLRELTKSKNI